MRKELENTYIKNPDGGLTVTARSRAGEIVKFDVDPETLKHPLPDGRVCELIPVIPNIVLLFPTEDLRGKVDPEKIMTFAARLTQSRMRIANLLETIDEKKIKQILEQTIMPNKHYSVIEKFSFLYGIEGVSRAFSHQFVRHRLMSPEQQSQREVDPLNPRYPDPWFEFVVPPSMRHDKDMFVRYVEVVKESLAAYQVARKSGADPEDARMFLQNAAATRLLVAMNARVLFEFLEKRTCSLAQWEIDIVATKMFEITYPWIPSVLKFAGPSCVRGPCTEGKRYCGLPLKPLHHYIGLESMPHDFPFDPKDQWQKTALEKKTKGREFKVPKTTWWQGPEEPQVIDLAEVAGAEVEEESEEDFS